MSVLVGVRLQYIGDSREKAIQLLSEFLVLGVVGFGGDEPREFVQVVQGKAINGALARSWPETVLLETRGLGHHRILKDPAVVQRAVRFLAERVLGDALSGAPLRSWRGRPIGGRRPAVLVARHAS